MKIKITTESTCDLSKELLESNNISVLPFHVILGENEFRDNENLTAKKLFEYVDQTGVLPKTAALSTFEYDEFFKKNLEGYDGLIHFALSSGLSSSYSNAVQSAKQFKNVYVIDTKSLSTGIGLLAMSAVDKIKEGKTINQIVEEIEAQVPKVQASFVINNLKFLHKGGRCSSLALLGANLLKIKPEIKLVNGKMVVGKKYRGKHEEVLRAYTKDVLSENNPDLTRAFVTHSSRVSITDEMIESVKKLGFKEVYETSAGATICSHCGPETIGILFINQ